MANDLDLGKVLGSRIHNVTAAPAASLGLLNDWAVNTANGDVYEKTADTVWTKQGNFKGPKGDTGATGPQGAKGDTGPTGATGAQGPQGVKGDTGATGPQGAKGDAFAIAKTYASIAAMNADFGGSDVKAGQFVMIDTGNVDDVDNAKLYVKGAAAYTYITDLSGATGMTGPQGPTGATGPKGATGATGPQGAKGDTGAAGPQGAAGTRGSRWNAGTAITGTSTTATVFSGSGITDALVNDMYLNTSTGGTYRCTVAGAASVAKWVYAGSIKGAAGAKGDTGAQGAQGPQGAKGATGAAGADGKTPMFSINASGHLIATYE